MKLKSKSDQVLQSPKSVSRTGQEKNVGSWLMQEFNIDSFLVWLLTVGFLGVVGSIVFSESNAPNVTKAKESEAKQYLNSIRKAQQANFVENEQFSNSIEQLGIGIESETSNYQYSLEVTPNLSILSAVSKHEKSRSYIGAVLASKDGRTTSILCQSLKPGLIQLAPPRVQNGVLTCSSDTELLP